MKLSHPGIPKVFDVDEDEEFTYIIEEYIEGENLKTFYQRREVGEDLLLEHLEQICSVLEYLQDQSIRLIHLDLKPENIVISDRVCIIDFGAARKEGERTGYCFYTEGYTAPECIGGEESAKQSDIFSLGKLIRFMTEHSRVSKSTGKRLEKIAQKCTIREQRSRIGSGVIVTAMLKRATKRKKRSGNKKEARARTGRIAVIGLARGCGATHVSVCLVSVLAERGKVVFAQTVRDESLGEQLVYRYKGAQGKGILYTAVGQKSGFSGSDPVTAMGAESTVVADLGSEPARYFKKAVARFDLVLVVGGGASWRQNDYDFLERMAKEKLLGTNCRVIVNMAGGDSPELLPYGIKAFRFPYEDNPFSPGSETRKLFGKIVGGS